MLRLVLLGPPGAGKGTQAERVSEELGIPHISTGNILRQAVAEETELGKKAKAIMEAGRLVSDDVMLGIIRERLAKPDAAGGFVLDGYPRTLPQAQALDRLLQEKERPPVLVVSIEVGKEELVRRIAGRRSCPECGAVYNVYSQPPRNEGRCDVCGHELSQRADDTEATVRERLSVYDRETRPVLEHYKGCLTRIDGTGPPDEVFQALLENVRSVAVAGRSEER